MYLFASDSTISTYLDGIFTNLISDLIWLLLGIIFTILLRYLIYKIPILAKPRHFWLSLRGIRYPNLRGYWINQNAYNNSSIDYDLMVVAQVGKSWKGRTIVTDKNNGVYYKSNAEIVNSNYLIGTWKKTNVTSSKRCGAFHVIIGNDNIIRGKSLKESNFDQTTEIGSNWIALKVKVTFFQRLGLMLRGKIYKIRLLNHLLTVNNHRALLDSMREEEERRVLALEQAENIREEE